MHKYKYKKYFLLVVILLGLTLTKSLAQTKQLPITLQMYKMEKHLVLVFAPTAANAQWQKQQQFLKQAATEMTTRDLVALGILETQVRSSEPAAGILPSAKALRQHYQVNPTAFEVILIGKDGGEKYRTQDVINPSKIFQIIDSMPMRQQEIRQGLRH